MTCTWGGHVHGGQGDMYMGGGRVTCTWGAG